MTVSPDGYHRDLVSGLDGWIMGLTVNFEVQILQGEP